MKKNIYKNKNIKKERNLIKRKVIVLPICIILGIILINLLNGNIQKIIGIDGNEALKADTGLIASNGNIGGTSSNNTQNDVLDTYQITYFRGLYAGEITNTDAARIKAAGFTTVELFGDRSKMDEALTILKANGLNAIVTDGALRWNITKLFNSTATGYNEAEAKRLIEDEVNL